MTYTVWHTVYVVKRNFGESPKGQIHHGGTEGTEKSWAKDKGSATFDCADTAVPVPKRNPTDQSSSSSAVWSFTFSDPCHP